MSAGVPAVLAGLFQKSCIILFIGTLGTLPLWFVVNRVMGCTGKLEKSSEQAASSLRITRPENGLPFLPPEARIGMVAALW